MEPVNNLIAFLDGKFQTEIKAIISDILQDREFYMHYPLDEYGNGVNELFMYWLGTTVELVYTRYHHRRYTVPSLELQCTLEEALSDYVGDVYSRIRLPKQFPAAFDVQQIDNSSFLFVGDKSQPVWESRNEQW